MESERSPAVRRKPDDCESTDENGEGGESGVRLVRGHPTGPAYVS